MKEFSQTRILVTGGAGFVGGNLVRRLLDLDVQSIHIVDNLLSAERINIPNDIRIAFTEGSIADDRVINDLGDEYDYVFHLSTYHGNQSSIHNPIADHENNLLTTLKLFERLKDFQRLKKGGVLRRRVCCRRKDVRSGSRDVGRCSHFLENG